MSLWLVNNTCKNNWKKIIHNNLKDLLSQRWTHSTSNCHNNLSTITENNYKMKLQCLLKQNNLTNKLAKQNNNTDKYSHSIEMFKKWKKTQTILKIKAYLVFPIIFLVLSQITVSTQVLFHSCLPFLDFLGEVMHFCKYAWIDLMDTYFIFFAIFSSIVPYWHAFFKND